MKFRKMEYYYYDSFVESNDEDFYEGDSGLVYF